MPKRKLTRERQKGWGRRSCRVRGVTSVGDRGAEYPNRLGKTPRFDRDCCGPDLLARPEHVPANGLDAAPRH